MEASFNTTPFALVCFELLVDGIIQNFKKIHCLLIYACASVWPRRTGYHCSVVLHASVLQCHLLVMSIWVSPSF